MADPSRLLNAHAAFRADMSNAKCAVALIRTAIAHDVGDVRIRNLIRSAHHLITAVEGLIEHGSLIVVDIDDAVIRVAKSYCTYIETVK